MKIGEGDPGSLLRALKEGRIDRKEARLRTATALLEGSFYQELFKVMRETVPDGGFGGGAGEDVFSALLDEHLAEQAAARTDRGIGAALYRHFADYVL